jgi:hypothetical protein
MKAAMQPPTTTIARPARRVHVPVLALLPVVRHLVADAYRDVQASPKRIAGAVHVSVESVCRYRKGCGSPLQKLAMHVVALELAGISTRPLILVLLRVRRDARLARAA